jgi:RNA polymerase sigma factor (sigma-70 family)
MLRLIPGVKDATPDTDCDLIRRSLGHPELFGIVFDRHFEPVFRFCLRRVGESGAEDAAGETFRRAFEHRDRYDCRSESALPWLYGIALNVVRNSYRSTNRLRSAVGRLSRTDDRGAQLDEVLSRVDAPADLARAAETIARLAPDDRDALLLLAWESLSYEEIASVQGVPLGTVKSRVNRARTQLREALESTK